MIQFVGWALIACVVLVVRVLVRQERDTDSPVQYLPFDARCPHCTRLFEDEATYRAHLKYFCVGLRRSA